ncbi:unnamed protein product [Linum trigynum]|uniref:Uncharacterized protein n=1 Tax=Linum trigynum TaxID=586398 RepID=A0AAV2E549_9ROSI
MTKPPTSTADGRRPGGVLTQPTRFIVNSLRCPTSKPSQSPSAAASKGSSCLNISPSDVELLNDRLTTKDEASVDRLRARTAAAADSASPQKPKFDLRA